MRNVLELFRRILLARKGNYNTCVESHTGQSFYFDNWILQTIILGYVTINRIE
jgi:hypothetical protein